VQKGKCTNVDRVALRSILAPAVSRTKAPPTVRCATAVDVRDGWMSQYPYEASGSMGPGRVTPATSQCGPTS